MGNFTFNEPNYKECIIEWLDTKEREQVTISIGGINPTFDDYIFYDCRNEEDFNNLKDKNSGEDFYIVEVLD
jgi:hypothetical protein